MVDPMNTYPAHTELSTGRDSFVSAGSPCLIQETWKR